MADESLNIVKIVRAAIDKSPVASDINFKQLSDSKVGSPLMVFDPWGEPSFWMIPLLIGKLVCGYANVNFSGDVTKIGIFGSRPGDSSSWIEESFFRQVPHETLKEIETIFPDFASSKPIFSYDSIPSKWGWMLRIINKSKSEKIIYITPGGWYEGQQNSDSTEG